MLLQVTKQCTDTNWRSLSLQWNACIVVGTLSLMVFLLVKFLTYCIAWHFFEFPKETSIESLVCLFTSYSTGLKLKCSTSFQNPENFSILIFILASARALAWAGVSSSVAAVAVKDSTVILSVVQKMIGVAKRVVGKITSRRLFFELLGEGLSCHENVWRSFPAASKHAITVLGLRLCQKLEQSQLLLLHPVYAVHRAWLHRYLPNDYFIESAA